MTLADLNARVDPTRRPALRSCAAAIARQLDARGEVSVVAVCTHNSRRSQLAEVWLAVASAAAGLGGVSVCSGGSDPVAVAPGAIAVLRERGFRVEADTADANPRLRVRGHGIERELYAKPLGEAVAGVPLRGGVALMVCAAADAACPPVPQVGYRARLPFADPRHADGTPGEAAAYRAASDRIEAEMRWLVRESR